MYSRDFRYTPTDRCDNSAATNYCNLVLFGIAGPGAAAGSANPLAALAGTGGGGPYHQNSWGVQDIASANADSTSVLSAACTFSPESFNIFSML